MSAEEWRAVPGYEGVYEVSDRGRVRSLDRVSSHGCRLQGKYLKPVSRGGYLRVFLRLNGTHKWHLVHRLVLTAFSGSPADQTLEARHLDGDASNNSASNLAWGTHKENVHDQLRHGTHVNAKKTHCLHGHPFDAENTYHERGSSGRRCRTCMRAQWKRITERRKAMRRAG